LSVSILTGDCREVLKGFAENSIDACVTDPPYGLSFMGKAWDYDVPAADTWREIYRVMKPGAHLLAFFGSRTYHRGVVQIEDAGFEIRDQIMWIYGSGFPKSHNLSGDREGWGTALKPAHEPIVVARKPLIGTVAQNVLQHGTGAININSCRVATEDRLGGGNNSATVDRTGKHEGWQRPWMQSNEAAASSAERSRQSTARSEALGRWPANVVHDGSEEVIAGFPSEAGAAAPVFKRNGDKFRNSYGAFKGDTDEAGSTFQNDKGSAARFFYCAKASKSDRDEGMSTAEQPIVTFATANGTSGKASSLSEGRATAYKNDHPTVKPTDLMRYLVRLVTPPGGTVLDPFMGSGSTGKAANIEGFSFIGIELDPKWNAIARARIFGSTPLFAQEDYDVTLDA
jgi:DNA modification methylase